MKKIVIGYIYNEQGLGEDEKLFIKVAKKKGIELVFFNIEDELNEREIEEKAKRCKLIYNNSEDLLALELIKTFEELGKRVVETADTFYYSEDKWMLFLRCKENKIHVPETVLIPLNLKSVKQELEKFNQWPVVLKRIDKSRGRFVEKADNIEESIAIIKKFWRKSSERIPIIAQEFVKSYCYRVFAIEGKIVQVALKEGSGWKLTGEYAKRFWRFKPDTKLKKIVKKIARITKIKILGIDLLKKRKDWLALEANAQPDFAFFASEREELIGKVLNFLKKEAQKRKS